MHAEYEEEVKIESVVISQKTELEKEACKKVFKFMASYLREVSKLHRKKYFLKGDEYLKSTPYYVVQGKA